MITSDSIAKVSFTKRSDIGYVLAKALEDPQIYETAKQNGVAKLAMQGSTMTWEDALKVLAKVVKKEVDITYTKADDSKKKEAELLQKGMEGDMGAFFGAFREHLIGEPGRGNVGGDLSLIEIQHYGVNLATLEETLEEVYGGAV